MLKGKTWSQPRDASASRSRSRILRFRRYALMLLVVALFLWAIYALAAGFGFSDYFGRSLIGASTLPWGGPTPKSWENDWECECKDDHNRHVNANPVLECLYRSLEPWRSGGVTKRLVRDVYKEWRPFGGSASYPELVMVRIHKKELYLVFSKHSGQDLFRIDGLARALSDMVHYAKENNHDVPDAEFLVNISDSPVVMAENENEKHWGPSKTPPLVFSTCRRDPFMDVLIPFPNSDPAIYRTLLSRTGVPWNARHTKLFWRGSPTDGNSMYEAGGKWRAHPRAVLVGMSSSDVDARFTTYIQVTEDAVKEMSADPAYTLADSVPLGAIGTVKYAADLDGNTFTERTPSLMAQGALVFRQDSPWKVFYSPAIHPWVHYVPLSRNMSNVLEAVRWAKEHDDIAHEIAQRGRQFVMDELNRPRLACYWLHVVTEYAKLQDYEVTLDTDVDSDADAPFHVPSKELYVSGWLRETILALLDSSASSSS